MSIHKREHTPDRRAFRQVKRLFMLTGVVQAYGCGTVHEIAKVYESRVGENVSVRQLRRDLALLAELGVLEEQVRDNVGPGSKVQYRYKFEGWRLPIH